MVTDFKIELERPTPSYLQLEQVLRDAIASRRLEPGSRLPEERILARDLGLSRGTVRRALSALESQGLIVRRKGRGTYVTDPADLVAMPIEVFLRQVHAKSTDNGWTGRVLQGMFESSGRLGCELVLREAASEHARVNAGAAATVFFAPEEHEPVRALAAQGRVVVCADTFVPGVDSVVFDNTQGAREAVARLVSMGHRRIAFLGGLFRRGGGWLESANSHERLAGYRAALKDAGLEDECVWWLPLDPKDVRESFLAQLQNLPPERRPTALFGTDESAALGAWMALAEAGQGVPRGLGIASFRDADAPAPGGIDFTSVAISPVALGARVIERVVERQRGRAAQGSSAQRIVVPHAWNEGETCKPPSA
ncbi:MAG: LacI family transcriptional regulator [Planctomycetota bacterium]|nr:LacI family transcriptional regulator [Planctomycetota bacterium]